MFKFALTLQPCASEGVVDESYNFCPTEKEQGESVNKENDSDDGDKVGILEKSNGYCLSSGGRGLYSVLRFFKWCTKFL